MPLEDTLWEKGKCGLKLIQYMACALPVVSSPSPSALEILNGIGEEFIASNLTEWEASLEKLIIDESLRHQYGFTARNRIFSLYTYQYWGPKYGQIIKMAVS
jgi:glycosyltransferase involved in cell wall biosynthesis